MSTREYLKSVLPEWCVSRFRVRRDARRISRFQPRTVSHCYGDIRLSVRIADPVAATWYDNDGPELPEIAFLRRSKLKPGARVFDVGAHQAVFAILMAKIVGEKGSVIALEPARFNHDIGLRNVELNKAVNLVLLNAAVSDVCGFVPFLDCLNGKVSPSGNAVRAVTIDSLTEQYGVPDVVFVDVEGFEWQALKGAVSTLQSDPDWYIEVHTGCGLENAGGSAEDIIELFKRHSYSLFCQTDPHYRRPFSRLRTVPKDRFFLIATKHNAGNDPSYLGQ